jgi:exodeoxyribonuclease VIII
LTETTTIETGIFKALPESEYHALPAASSSTLKLFDRSAAHAREARMHPKAPTPALITGSAVHKAILQPELFAAEYVRGLTNEDGNPVQRRSNADKARWAEFEEANAGKGILSAAEWRQCEVMRDEVWSHPTAQDLLAAAVATELSVIWVDPETGVTCKLRADALSDWLEWSWIVDLKTTEDASPQAFSRSIANYGYDQSAAFYLDGMNVVAPRERRWLWLVVEKSPPHGIALYEPDAETIEQGRREYKRQLRLYAHAEQTGQWLGYTPEVQRISLPKWAVERDDDEVIF